MQEVVPQHVLSLILFLYKDLLARLEISQLLSQAKASMFLSVYGDLVQRKMFFRPRVCMLAIKESLLLEAS